jgi:glutathione synthase
MSKITKIAVQMDPMEPMDIMADSTFALMLEAQNRGFEIYHYLAPDLSLLDGEVIAWGRPVTVRAEVGNHYSFGEYFSINLREMGVVLMRQDPPFNMSYITATHILDLIHPNTLVVNNPCEVRNAPEKLYSFKFKGIMPPTLITERREDIKAFRDAHKDIILKPLYGNGGVGVFRIKPDDENLNSLLEMFKNFYKEPIIAQAYLPAVRDGDKRIILIDGEPVGAINRVPAIGEARSNMHVGGRAERIGLTSRDLEICNVIGPDLKARGLIFVGIDIIGEYLTEINVTSPTGIQEIGRFDGVNLAAKTWDAIESK